jgi:Zn-dependent protease with chaperone function
VNEEGLVSDLFASHPPMAARIAALKEMAFQERPRSA